MFFAVILNIYFFVCLCVDYFIRFRLYDYCFDLLFVFFFVLDVFIVNYLLFLCFYLCFYLYALSFLRLIYIVLLYFLAKCLIFLLYYNLFFLYSWPYGQVLKPLSEDGPKRGFSFLRWEGPPINNRHKNLVLLYFWGF